MTDVNRIYGYMVNSSHPARKTTTTRTGLSETALRLIEALVPRTLALDAREALAEFYIRLCYTDKELLGLLNKVDPINSYTLHSFYPHVESDVEIMDIVKNLKKIGLPDVELSFLPVDYILCGLKHLMRAILNG